MKKILTEWRKYAMKEAYYGGVPGEPETPAGYGGALDAAKAQQHLSDEIDDLVRLGKIDINDLSVETLRANQEIPWDKFQAIDDEVLGDIIRDYQRKKKFYRESLQEEPRGVSDLLKSAEMIRWHLGALTNDAGDLAMLTQQHQETIDELLAGQNFEEAVKALEPYIEKLGPLAQDIATAHKDLQLLKDSLKDG